MLTTILLIPILIIILTLAFSYYGYRIAFYAPKRTGEEALYRLPQGAQYEEFIPNISKSIDEMLAASFEAVTITGHDGHKLFARYYHTQDDAPLQIQFHGYKSSAYVDFCGGRYLACKVGHNALVVDQRSHGKSDGTTITFGIRERKDCLSWINYACERFGKDIPIILSGLSMGAATVLMASDLELPDNVKGIIADCPYSSPKEIICKVGKDMHFPPKLMYPFVKLGAFLFGHFNLEESSAVAAVSNAKIPILLIHGEDDRFVPCEMSRAIHNARPTHSTLVTIPNAGHGLCYMVDPKRYEEAIMEFVRSILD